MADRKASVALELQAGQFKAEALTVERKIDDIDDKVEKLDKDITKIPADAAKAGAAMKLLGGDVGAVGDKVGSLGEKATGLSVLDAKIKASRTEVRKLADEFVKTGDVDVFKKLGEAEGKLRGLQDVRKKLANALVDGVEDAGKTVVKTLAKAGTDAGRETGKTFTASLQGALSTPLLGPILVAALAAAAVPAGTIVGANIGGALLAGAAAAGVAGGLIGAWMGNPEKYGAQWAAMLLDLKTRWLGATDQFGKPLEDSLHEVDRVLRDLPIERLMAISKSFVDPLVRGAGGGITAAVDGLTDFLAAAQPVVDTVGPKLTNLGNAIGDSFRAIGYGSEGGASALGDLIDALGWVARATGIMIMGFENAYGPMRKMVGNAWDLAFALIPGGDALKVLAEHAMHIEPTLMVGARALRGIGESAIYSADDLGQLSQQLNATELSVDSLAGKMVGKIFAATMGLDQATLGVAESLTRLDETMDKNGKAIDKHTGLVAKNTEKGQANREGVLAAVTANMSMYQSQLAVGMSAEDAAKNYDVNTAALEEQLRQADLTGAQIDDLVGKYRGIPKKVDTDIAMHGLTDAIDRLNETIRLINGLHDKTITITVKQVGDNPKGQSRGGNWATGGIRRAAAGMIVPPSNPGTVLFGEPQTGGEALIPLKGISQSRAMGLAQTVGNAYGFTVSASRVGGGGGGGGGVQTIHHVVDIVGGGELIRRLVITGASNRGQSVGTFLGVG